MPTKTKRIWGSISYIRQAHQEYITFVNIYVPNIRAPKYTQWILTAIKREIENSTIIVNNINAPTYING